MKILFVVSRPIEINTSASIRNKSLINGMCELGHEVDYLTSVPDKNHSNYDSSLSLNVHKSYYFEVGGIQKIAKFSRKFNFLKKFKSFIYKMLENKNIYDNLKGICDFADKKYIDINSYDLVISSSDPKSSHLFVKNFFDKYGKQVKWYQIWGDPFLDDITNKSDKKKDKLIFKEEYSLLKKADKIFYVTKPTVEKQQSIYPTESSKMIYTPIPYEKKIIYGINEKNMENLTLLYTGDFNSSIRNIEPLLESFENSKHKLIICGDSDLNIKSSESIKILPRQKYSEIKKLEESSDILIHLSNLKGTQIPGKIYQYSGTNKPILFILDGEKKMIMENFKDIEDRYIFCQNTKEDILDKINSLNLTKSNYNPVEKFDKVNIVKNIFKEN